MQADEIELIIEEVVGELYLRYYQLRQMGEYQREYDLMGTLINMLQQDRQTIREKYGDKIDL